MSLIDYLNTAKVAVIMVTRDKFGNIKYSLSTHFNANEYRWENLRAKTIKEKGYLYFKIQKNNLGM